MVTTDRPGISGDFSRWIKILAGGGILLVGVLILLIPRLGVNEDALQLMQYGNQILDYVLSGFRDYPQILEAPRNWNEETERYYGTLFELPAAFLGRFVAEPLGMDPVIVRHALNVLYFLVGVVFLLAIAWRLGGGQMAGIVLFLVLTSPRLLGHAVVNPKDIPFWSAYLFCLWAFIRLWGKVPDRVQLQDFIWMAVALGTLIGIRLGGLVWIAYLALFLGIRFLGEIIRSGSGSAKPVSHYWTRIILLAGGTAIAGWFLGILWIPFVLEDPITRTIEGFQMLARFPVSISVVFDGMRFPSTYRPWYYPLVWMGITIPAGVWLGYILGLGDVLRRLWVDLRTEKRLQPVTQILGIIAFVGIFPVAYVVIRQSNLYDGWRHLLFTYGPFLLLSGWGWYRLFQVGKGWFRKGVRLLLPLSQGFAIYWLVFQFPHYFVFFNGVVGGLPGAYGRYELDYYQTSIKGAIQHLQERLEDPHWLKTMLERYHTDTLVVVSNSFPTLKYYLREWIIRRGLPVRLAYVRYYQRHQHEWHLAVWYPRFIDPGLLEAGWYPPQEVLYAERAGGKPLSVVQARPSVLPVQIFRRMQAGTVQGLDSLFVRAIQQDPRNELLLEMYLQFRLQMGRIQGLSRMLDTLIRALPGYPPFWVLYARLLAGGYQDLSRAIALLERIRERRPFVIEVYVELARLYLIAGRFRQALQLCEEGLRYWPYVPAFYQILAYIARRTGNESLAREYERQARRLQGG